MHTYYTTTGTTTIKPSRNFSFLDMLVAFCVFTSHSFFKFSNPLVAHLLDTVLLWLISDYPGFFLILHPLHSQQRLRVSFGSILLFFKLWKDKSICKAFNTVPET